LVASNEVTGYWLNHYLHVEAGSDMQPCGRYYWSKPRPTVVRLSSGALRLDAGKAWNPGAGKLWSE